MNRFIGEYYDGSVKKDDPDALHRAQITCPECEGSGLELKTERMCLACKGTKVTNQRNDCYSKKNRMNNDVVSIQDSGGKMDRYDEENPTKKS